MIPIASSIHRKLQNVDDGKRHTKWLFPVKIQSGSKRYLTIVLIIQIYSFIPYNRMQKLSARYFYEQTSRKLTCPPLLALYPRAARPKRRRRRELLTTVTDEKAIAAAAKMGALSRKNGISGERIAAGIRITL